eukprot:gene26376-28881_t
MNGKEALQMMIQAGESRIAAASSSPAGTVPSSEIDLVLMDIQMPVMDGLEAVTLYRAHESPLLEKLQQAAQTSPASSAVQLKPLLIIGMSACSDVDIIEKGLSIGMDRFVAKPFQIHHLTPILNESFPTVTIIVEGGASCQSHGDCVCIAFVIPATFDDVCAPVAAYWFAPLHINNPYRCFAEDAPCCGSVIYIYRCGFIVHGS